MDLLTVIVLANFGFTCGAYLYTWRLERRMANHLVTRVRRIELALGITGLDKLTEE